VCVYTVYIYIGGFWACFRKRGEGQAIRKFTENENIECILSIVYCTTLHSTHYTLYTPHYTLHTIHYTLYTPYSVFIIHIRQIEYTLYTTHYTLHTIHYTHLIVCSLSTSAKSNIRTASCLLILRLVTYSV